MKRSTLVAALAALVVPVVGIVAVIPLLAFGMGTDSPSASCVATGSASSEVGPTILGSSAVDARSIMDWWFAAGRGQSPRLGLVVDEVVALYLSEGEAEGVRGDLALVQAIYETGWFTNGDTARNNFAGIAHPDGAAAGRAFPDVATGVRAHVQLLKKYAAGNDTTLAHPDVAPDAGAQARRWDQLAGTWASAPDYWARISTLYRSLLTAAGEDGSTACPPSPRPAPRRGTPGRPATSR